MRFLRTNLRPNALGIILASGIECLAASAFLTPYNSPKIETPQTEITSPERYKVDKNVIGYISTSTGLLILASSLTKREERKQYIIQVSAPRLESQD